jgi:hypothetical protein
MWDSIKTHVVSDAVSCSAHQELQDCFTALLEVVVGVVGWWGVSIDHFISHFSTMIFFFASNIPLISRLLLWASIFNILLFSMDYNIATAFNSYIWFCTISWDFPQTTAMLCTVFCAFPHFLFSFDPTFAFSRPSITMLDLLCFSYRCDSELCSLHLREWHSHRGFGLD